MLDRVVCSLLLWLVTRLKPIVYQTTAQERGKKVNRASSGLLNAMCEGDEIVLLS